MERSCSFCDVKFDDEETVEFRTCDGCGLTSCQHTIGEFDDDRFEYQQNYCFDCENKPENQKHIY